MIREPISADSHITEPPNCYLDFIDPAFPRAGAQDQGAAWSG